MSSTVTLSASARYGYGGKQFVARITGRHPKFTFAYEFMGRKEGKRGESTSVTIDTPGLYLTRDIDSKGRADDSACVVFELNGSIEKRSITRELAMKLAKKLDASDTPDWTAMGRAWIADELRGEIEKARAAADSDRVSQLEGDLTALTPPAPVVAAPVVAAAPPPLPPSSTLSIAISPEQAERLETLADHSSQSLDAYIGELIDYAWYRWKPADGSEGTEITLVGVTL